MNVTTHAHDPIRRVELDDGRVYIAFDNSSMLVSMTPAEAESLRDMLTAALAEQVAA